MNRQTVRIVIALAVIPSCKGDDLQPAADAGRDATRIDAPGDPEPDGAVDTGLILHYAFEDAGATVMDSSSRGKHGALSDPTAWTEQGRVGRGLAMSGANPATQFVALPDGIFTGVEDFSIAVWVKLQSASPWARIYDIGNGLADPANRFMYFTPNGFLGPANGVLASFYGGSTANELAIGSGTQLPLGVWKHLVITGSGGDRTIYVDGYPAAKITGGPAVAPKEMEPISSASWLGKSRFPDPGLDGTIDEFRIYDRVLTGPEIAELGWPGADYSYWRFDDGAGATAVDSSDHAIPTVLAGGVTWTAGKLGGAVDFPGGAAGAAGPTVTLATNPLRECASELSVSAWVKLRTLTPWSRIFDFGSATTHFIYLAPTDGAGMHFAMVSPSGVFDLITPTPPIEADDAWHHVAVTVDRDGLTTLFVDGASVMTQASPNVRPGDFANLNELWLGKSRFPDPYLDGAIDDLRIGCRALTADEIKDLSRP